MERLNKALVGINDLEAVNNRGRQSKLQSTLCLVILDHQTGLQAYDHLDIPRNYEIPGWTSLAYGGRILITDSMAPG